MKKPPGWGGLFEFLRQLRQSGPVRAKKELGAAMVGAAAAGFAYLLGAPLIYVLILFALTFLGSIILAAGQ